MVYLVWYQKEVNGALELWGVYSDEGRAQDTAAFIEKEQYGIRAYVQPEELH